MAKLAYNQEQEQTIINALEPVTSYDEQAEVLRELADAMGKKPASLIAKASSLSKLGKCEYITKSSPKKGRANGVETKAEKVARLCSKIEANVELFDSLEKSTVYVLDALLKALEA